LLAVVALTVPVVLERIQRADRAADTADAVRLAGRIGALVEDIQLERMLSVGYLMRTAERSRVEQQSKAVTDHAARITTEANGADPDLELPPAVAAAVAGVENLAPLRSGVLNGITAPDKLIVGYGEVVTALLDSLGLERGVDVSTPEGRQVVALDASLRTDELITSGAAYLVIAVATKKAEALVPYYSNLAVLQATVARFQSFATPAQTALYTQAQEELQKGFGTSDFVATPDVNPLQVLARVPLATVFPALLAVVGPGEVVSSRIINDVTDQVNDQQNQALTTAYGVAGLSLLVLLLVALLGAAVARSVIGPLTRLTRSAERVARVTEEELTRVADDESESTSPVHLDPIEVGARDEIGDLARAFERVQGTAAGLVERQVASRRNVAQMFGHVGRRTQNLVARQIALIDRLEDEETDPERLQHLYRLDHVSSRLRRNAGSLVVLSGATGANEHLNPLPLGDVVRLALGEIEDYARVDVRVPAEYALAPAVINDMVLVLAELMENATVFSPPHTRVTVMAQPTTRGVRLSVVDHGIGLAPEQMEQENARLQRRERLDLAPTGVLGLFVVGRLARRHNLGVVLTPTPGGGTTATVDVGDELLAAAWAAPGSIAGLQAAHALAPGMVGVSAGAPPGPRTVAGPAVPALALPAGPGGRPETVEYRLAPGETAAAPGESGGFNVAAVDRASRSISAGSSWSAFVPHQRSGPEVDVPTAGRPAAGLPVPGRPVGDDDQPTTVLPAVTAAPARSLLGDFESGVRRAQAQTQALPTLGGPAAAPAVSGQPAGPALPTAGGRPPVVPAAPALPTVPVQRPAPPVVAAGTPAPAPLPQQLPGPGPLTRRQPGATLDAQRDLPRAGAPPATPPDPDEARELVEQFEAGVVRALSEVRANNPRHEGTTR
jgi:signal transduction histidine kinase